MPHIDHSSPESSKKVVMIGTGGTIQNTQSERIDGDRLLQDLRQYRLSLPCVAVKNLLRVGSVEINPSEWKTIASAVAEAALEKNVTGVVVTHGTYTVEETAYYLHLTVPTTKPVIVACSQRRHATPGNDGDKNLLDAFAIATSDGASGRGIMVTLNEEIHSAREVRKINQRPGGFVSYSSGILGSVESDQVTFYRNVDRRHTIDSEFAGMYAGEELARVDIVSTYSGADGVAVRAFVEAGARGLVVEGFAYSGKPHPWQLPDLEEASNQGVAIVLVNRGGGGRVPRDSDDDVRFIRGDNLSAAKARILLSLGLTTGLPVHELQRIFDQY